MTATPGAPQPSDSVSAIEACGAGDVVASVVSMSARHPDGRDDEYVAWHLLDHLPEQYRLGGLRLGQRWVSTPECRAARAASAPPFDAVDHVVQYLFAAPVEPARAQFFALGAALHAAGRMPMALPRVHLGEWALDRTLSAARVLVGSAVLPWRPATGAYLVVEQGDARDDALVDVPGVAGAWRWSGTDPANERLDSTADLSFTVAYLDGPPLEVAAVLVPVLTERWAAAGVTPLLAGPFELATVNR